MFDKLLRLRHRLEHILLILETRAVSRASNLTVSFDWCCFEHFIPFNVRRLRCNLLRDATESIEWSFMLNSVTCFFAFKVLGLAFFSNFDGSHMEVLHESSLPNFHSLRENSWWNLSEWEKKNMYVEQFPMKRDSFLTHFSLSDRHSTHPCHFSPALRAARSALMWFHPSPRWCHPRLLRPLRTDDASRRRSARLMHAWHSCIDWRAPLSPCGAVMVTDEWENEIEAIRRCHNKDASILPSQTVDCEYSQLLIRVECLF